MDGCRRPFGCQALCKPDYDCVVTGTLTPDCTGGYFEHGTFDGKPLYRKDNSSWYIYWDEYEAGWVIQQEYGSVESDYWVRHYPNPFGEYEPGEPGFGTATVTGV